MTPRFLAIPCPWCGKINEAVTPLEEGTVPFAGAPAICVGCTQISIFDDDLELRLPSERESLYFQNHPRAQIVREYLQQYRLKQALRKGLSGEGV